MDNHTVVQLKAIAKERGVRGYYKLRNAELIHDLGATGLEEQTNNILDESITNVIHSSFTTNTLVAMKCHDDR